MTLDTVADESRKKMADDVARSPSRLCNRDAKTCCYGDALSTIFLLLAFAVFLFFFFPASRYGYLRVPWSVQQPSATLSKYLVLLYEFYLEYVFFLLVSFVPSSISEFFGFLLI